MIYIGFSAEGAPQTVYTEPSQDQFRPYDGGNWVADADANNIYIYVQSHHIAANFQDGSHGIYRATIQPLAGGVITRIQGNEIDTDVNGMWPGDNFVIPNLLPNTPYRITLSFDNDM